MSENDLGDALRKLGATESPGAAETARRALNRDRRRIRLLAGLAILLWLLAVTGIGLVLRGFYAEYLPYQRGLLQAAEQAAPDAARFREGHGGHRGGRRDSQPGRPLYHRPGPLFSAGDFTPGGRRAGRDRGALEAASRRPRQVSQGARRGAALR